VYDDKLIVYATGGLAYANLDHNLFDPAPPFNLPPFSQTDGGVKAGWTVGGGIEWLRHANWSLRAEALYVDLGNQSHHYVLCGAPCTADTDWDDSFWVARLGLNYRFGPEPQAAPLK
jgi:outer membrane immunogenic protein